MANIRKEKELLSIAGGLLFESRRLSNQSRAIEEEIVLIERQLIGLKREEQREREQKEQKEKELKEKEQKEQKELKEKKEKKEKEQKKVKK